MVLFLNLGICSCKMHFGLNQMRKGSVVKFIWIVILHLLLCLSMALCSMRATDCVIFFPLVLIFIVWHSACLRLGPSFIEWICHLLQLSSLMSPYNLLNDPSFLSWFRKLLYLQNLRIVGYIFELLLIIDSTLYLLWYCNYFRFILLKV